MIFSPQAMVSCQMLSELEEVIQYKLVPERREIIRQIWWERLQVHPCEGQGWRCCWAGMDSFLLSHSGGSANLSMSLPMPTWLCAPSPLCLSWLPGVLVWAFIFCQVNVPEVSAHMTLEKSELSLEIDVYRRETPVTSPRLLISILDYIWKYWFRSGWFELLTWLVAF